VTTVKLFSRLTQSNCYFFFFFPPGSPAFNKSSKPGSAIFGIFFRITFGAEFSATASAASRTFLAASFLATFTERAVESAALRSAGFPSFMD